MWSGILVLLIKSFIVDARIILTKYEAEASTIVQDQMLGELDSSQERFTDLKPIDQEDNDSRYKSDLDRKPDEKSKKPCSIVVLSHIQNPSMQSLLRRYRYDANGILIPGSVKYFIKLPQGLKSAPLLVPLNDKAFSPLGGFVRYYKEVPPIPQAW